ncbi:uncharacterized protein LOC113457738 [Microtus ochrogaster]|uniref:Uncharacterized protein LOC113457738 n=1 Tax=Microtus ochrogaster TaxID=79684 RepID=A0ABM1UK91_MICOH|nr:uncharacterized protein LOC113457738 [Microtus ochrogaster]
MVQVFSAACCFRESSLSIQCRRSPSLVVGPWPEPTDGVQFSLSVDLEGFPPHLLPSTSAGTVPVRDAGPRPADSNAAGPRCPRPLRSRRAGSSAGSGRRGRRDRLRPPRARPEHALPLRVHPLPAPPAGPWARAAPPSRAAGADRAAGLAAGVARVGRGGSTSELLRRRPRNGRSGCQGAPARVAGAAAQRLRQPGRPRQGQRAPELARVWAAGVVARLPPTLSQGRAGYVRMLPPANTCSGWEERTYPTLSAHPPRSPGSAWGTYRQVASGMVGLCSRDLLLDASIQDLVPALLSVSPKV